MPDFEGDRHCVSHHACECLQRKAAERDRLQADLSSLRAAVTEEIERLRRDAKPVSAARLAALLPDTSRDRGEGT